MGEEPGNTSGQNQNDDEPKAAAGAEGDAEFSTEPVPGTEAESETPAEKLAGEDEDSEEDLLRLFVGPNADKFIRIYQAQQAKKAGMSFNWAVLIAALPWLFYRKLYLTGLGVLLLPMALLYVFPAIPNGALTGLSVALVMVANAYYVGVALRQIKKLKALNLPREELHERLKKSGGTSPIGAAIGGVIVAALLALMIYGLTNDDLPGCDDATVRDLAEELVIDVLGTEDLRLRNFTPVASDTDMPEQEVVRNICSFRVELDDEQLDIYLAVTWQDKIEGLFQVQLGESPEALM
ncbi:DUF2628 domain-containing protein [Kiloniella laminariae]|uniref:DUF2628 domain-containing protein n=1 Tax=Kiloniella laminariae TaxID=454162 RepID=A0ABT4LES8_9PROT|nr:DUF2628 domain-containing protein [Kiloniella laminariae]MCZ4279611.1 DUF2628 domain-containing protein [Kiloniella laminariae]